MIFIKTRDTKGDTNMEIYLESELKQQSAVLAISEALKKSNENDTVHLGGGELKRFLTVLNTINAKGKTPRDNYSLTAIISIYKKLCSRRAFCFMRTVEDACPYKA